MPNLYTLSAKDIQVLQSVVAAVKRDSGPRGGDFDGVLPRPTTEVYLALTPAGGIPASTTTGGTTFTIGKADCIVYRHYVDSGGVHRVETTRLVQTVFNPALAAVGGNTLVPIARDKYGTWWTAGGGGGGGGGTGAPSVFNGVRWPSTYATQPTSVPNNTSTYITGGGGTEFDADGYWISNGPVTFKITKPGYYMVGFSGYFTALANSAHASIIRSLSGVSNTIVGGATFTGPGTDANPSRELCLTGLAHLEVNVLVQAAVYQDSGFSQTWNTWEFWLAKMGSTLGT